eukprot:464062-Pleurochrysis_carterae.AAC.6
MRAAVRHAGGLVSRVGGRLLGLRAATETNRARERSLSAESRLLRCAAGAAIGVALLAAGMRAYRR